MKTSLPIYVINLKRNPERKIFIQRQLDAFNLDYQFVDAIDKYDLETSQDRAQIAGLFGVDKADLEYKHRNGVRIANLLSHLKAYNLMVKNNDDIVCILEDDAVLLPTFPAMLASVTSTSNSSWDILMLSSHSKTIRKTLENSIYKRIMKFNNCAVLAKHPTKSVSDMYEQITKLLGCSPQYPKRSKTIMKILEEFTNRYKELIKLYNPNKNLVWLLSQNNDGSGTYKRLILGTACQLGGLPLNHSKYLMDNYHHIAEPAERCTSAMAYLLNQSAAKKWKTMATACNTLKIDSIPWHLHKNKKINLCLMSLPCVVLSDNYLKYSAHHEHSF